MQAIIPINKVSQMHRYTKNNIIDKQFSLKRKNPQKFDKQQVSSQQHSERATIHYLNDQSSNQSIITTSSENQRKFTIFSQENWVSKLDQIRSKIVGLRTVFKSPYKFQVQVCYADHTATNRPYKDIEEIINYSKTLAANPHTEFSHFGKYSTELMIYSLKSLLKSFSANGDEYVALPTGSGCTGAIEKTIKILKATDFKGKISIYITSYEHHSNILPWIQFYENVNVLPSDGNGNLLFEDIEKVLLEQNSQIIIVSVSAASNVTSKITDIAKINQIIGKIKINKHIILCVDCAAYCSHKEVNLEQLNHIDFLFISPHKNLGGSESCGVLIVKKNIIKSTKPTFPGGGTVKFVKGYHKEEDIMYEEDEFAREIAGTPPFLGFYRAALSFELLKDDITYDFIYQRQKINTNLFITLINEFNKKMQSQKKNIVIQVYGEKDFSQRANIITFNIINKDEKINHHLIGTVLTDIFGIQIRTGCFCAGPFGIQLLNLQSRAIQQLKDQVSLGIMKNKPGFCRLDLAFYFKEFEVNYLVKALTSIAQNNYTINLLYTICNDGEIQRLKYVTAKQPLYSLKSLSKMKIEQQNKINQNRQSIFKNQLQRGIQILENSVKFLKSIQQ